MPPIPVMQVGTGEQAALLTAFLWAIGALCFTAAGRAIGSRSVNRIRLVLAAVVMGGTMLALGHDWQIPAQQAVLLAVSGLVGLAIGDAFYFESLVVLGPRRATLITCLWPVFVALLQLPLTSESLGWIELSGMLLTLAGVMVVVRERAAEGEIRGSARRGILFGVLGALGQAVGILLAKAGLGSADPGSVLAYGLPVTGVDGEMVAGVAVSPVTGTFMRMSAAALVLWAMTLLRRDAGRTVAALGNRRAMALVAGGTMAGPVIGVALSLYAVSHANSAVASTIMSTMPIMVIPMVMLLYRERVSLRALGGTLLAMAGVAMLMGILG